MLGLLQLGTASSMSSYLHLLTTLGVLLKFTCTKSFLFFFSPYIHNLCTLEYSVMKNKVLFYTLECTVRLAMKMYILAKKMKYK